MTVLNPVATDSCLSSESRRPHTLASSSLITSFLSSLNWPHLILIELLPFCQGRLQMLLPLLGAHQFPPPSSNGNFLVSTLHTKLHAEDEHPFLDQIWGAFIFLGAPCALPAEHTAQLIIPCASDYVKEDQSLKGGLLDNWDMIG